MAASGKRLSSVVKAYYEKPMKQTATINRIIPLKYIRISEREHTLPQDL